MREEVREEVRMGWDGGDEARLFGGEEWMGMGVLSEWGCGGVR